jgi:hypothetical protein
MFESALRPAHVPQPAGARFLRKQLHVLGAVSRRKIPSPKGARAAEVACSWAMLAMPAPLLVSHTRLTYPCLEVLLIRYGKDHNR